MKKEKVGQNKQDWIGGEKESYSCCLVVRVDLTEGEGDELFMEMSRGRAIQQRQQLVQRPWGWLMPCELEEQQEDQCSWNEVNENEGNRRGS